MDDINFVREHYRNVVKQYRDQKDPLQADIPIFEQWLKQVNKVLEIGCASGFPIAQAILERGISYTGIDLSSKQIELARKEYPQWADCFIEAEMLDYVRNAEDEQYDGVVSMFSIRHLPRIFEAELFHHIKRILEPGGLFLLDHPQYKEEGRGYWFDDQPMYWSSFSQEWQVLTLTELGFQMMEEYTDTKIFLGKKETTSYFLYQKPGVDHTKNG